MESEAVPTVVVGVPARDEEALVGASVRAVLAAADAAAACHDGDLIVIVVVACDTCTDTTAAIINSIAGVDPRVRVLEGGWCSAGASRAAAIAHGLALVGRQTPLEHVWVATTDADTVVRADWLRQQLDHWSLGDHAVAGIVELLDGSIGGDRVAAAFRANYALGVDSHRHVHGANLGVRADAYMSVGGFPEIQLAEDHALWRALMAAGYRCRSSVALRVATSAREQGRAPGGFADTLAQHVSGEAL